MKAGCGPEQAEAVRQAFANAPLFAKQAFHIQPLPGNDTAFTWQRVAAKAVKIP